MEDLSRRRFLSSGGRTAVAIFGASLPLISVSTLALLSRPPPRIDDSISDVAHRAAEIAISEWQAWGGQYVDGADTSTPIRQAVGAVASAVETDPGYRQRVLIYLKVGVYPDTDEWRLYVDTPWSASFISYCMRMAGAGDRFSYAIGHHSYVSDASRNAVTQKREIVLVAYPSSDMAPQVGDLLWRGRKSSASPNTASWGMDRIIKHLKDGWEGFPSHCDLVVSVDLKAGRIHAIGGNLADRVLRLQLRIDDKGLLEDDHYRVVVRNNIGKFASR